MEGNVQLPGRSYQQPEDSGETVLNLTIQREISQRHGLANHSPPMLADRGRFGK